jgi:hypothetical protein
MIYTLLKQIPGTILGRVRYEYQRAFPMQPTPPVAETAATPADPMLSEGQQLLVSLQANSTRQLVAVHRATTIEVARAPESFHNQVNPLNRHGAKVFSQNGEDGLTFEIIRRIGLSKGVFVEFGVEDGRENNTLALAAAGWNGFWVGAEDLAFDFNPNTSTKLNFNFDRQWVTRENVLELYNRNLQRIGQQKSNLVSMDLDGNDYYFVEELLKGGASPEIFIVEYNGKFRPPIEFVIEYDEHHQWQGDDYYGASLASFYKLFLQYGYFLVCCDLTGLNAFFVRNDHRAAFADVPLGLHQIYESPKYYFAGLHYSGHPLSPRTLNKIFSQLNPPDLKS